MLANNRLLSTISLILIVGFLFIGIVFPTTSLGNETAEVPTWHEDDSWVYEFKQAKDENSRIYINVTSEHENVDIDEEIFETYEVNWTWIYEGQIFKEVYFNSIEELAEVAIIADDGTVRLYKPPRQQLNFPLEVGKDWSVKSTQYIEEDPGEPAEEAGTSEADYIVEDKVKIETPAGRFDTFKINMTTPDEDIYNIYYYSPEVKNIVKIEYIQEIQDDNDQIMAERVLMSYNLEEGEPNSNGDDTPFLGIGTVALIIASTAIFYHVKKKERREI